MQLKRNKEMEFETLKKSHKKQIVIGVLAICIIGGTLTFNLTRAKYKITESIPLVKGNVNYSVPDMRVVAINVSEDGTNYTITNEIPTTGYGLNTEKSMCKVATEISGIENAPQDSNITFEYVDSKLNIKGVSKRNTRCYLYFDKKKPTGSETILANITYKTTTPDFSQVAETDEGVYAVEDGMYGGKSYYWRGAATTNYVKFANYCWRIVRINGDGSIRLIYDGTACHVNGTNTVESIAKTSAYNTKNSQSNYVGWTYEGQLQRPSTFTKATASNAKTQLESWYSSNILGTDVALIEDGKFCNDRNVKAGNTWAISGSEFYYAANERILTEHSPSLACNSSDAYTLNVGLITADEVAYAGGVYSQVNNKYYLYNGQYYWTMSPYGATTQAVEFYVYSEGSLMYNYVNLTTPGLRPVINLKSNVTFSSGDGTLNNPYVVQ